MGQIDKLAMLVLASCVLGCSESTEPVEGHTFVIEVSGERFRIRATNADAVAALERRQREGIVGVVAGNLVAGDGGFNDGWSWHLEPQSVHAPDLAIEVCDGRPSMVENDLAYWLDTVEAFCPWGSTVVPEGA